jgi:hypothetical protein
MLFSLKKPDAGAGPAFQGFHLPQRERLPERLPEALHPAKCIE